MNTYKKQEKETKSKGVSEGAKRVSAARKYLSMLNVIGLIDKKIMIKMLPFAFFLMGLSLVYIANSYVAEKNIREIDKTAKEIKELRSEYISVKSDLMFKSRQSQVAKEVEAQGIKQLTVPPKKIVLKNSTEK
ncbi:MAG: hypothetical protein JSS90_04085 [Bacteroidetes bacterium]|jgi:hypothetical protein|nr:hypothetical protein [Bacteroidota bacterium]